ncbi:hypothetical protein F4815DRAFT_444141 [Daldinia loculata]|nr:hypothetical protein F4815DRAFT_444141 [Daldinia loculata]
MEVTPMNASSGGKSSELRHLRYELKRLKTYLAVLEYDLGLPEQKTEDWAGEEWISKRGQKRRERAERRRQRGRAAQNARERVRKRQLGLHVLPSPSLSDVQKDVNSKIDRKIASYRNRIKRTSVQLLVAATAGHQYRKTDSTTGQGHPDVRRTSSSSNEMVARMVRNLINKKARGKRPAIGYNPNDSDDYSVSDESDVSNGNDSYLDDSDTNITELSGSESEFPTSKFAAALMSRVEAAPGPGDWADKLTQPVIAKYAKKGPPLNDTELHLPPHAEEEKDPRPQDKPATPKPEHYDPKQWKEIGGILHESKTDSTLVHTDQPPEEIGVMTWEQQEKAYPTLKSILEMGEEYGRWDPGYLDTEKPDPTPWDPDLREQNESKPGAERLPLEANLTTKISLERIRVGFERPEMNTEYTRYSQVPAILPARLSDEDMMRGPLPTPPRLPLKGPSGRVITLQPTPKAITPAQLVHANPYLKQPPQNPVDPANAPIAQYHYPVDSPVTSTFKFNDGNNTSEVVKQARPITPITVTYQNASVAKPKEQVRNVKAGREVRFVEQPKEMPAQQQVLEPQQQQQQQQQLLPTLEPAPRPPPSQASTRPNALPPLPSTPLPTIPTESQPAPPPPPSGNPLSTNDPWWHYTSSDVDTTLYPAKTGGPILQPLQLPPPAAANNNNNNNNNNTQTDADADADAQLQLQTQILSESRAAASGPGSLAKPLRSALPLKGTGGVVKSARKKGHVRFGGTQTLTFGGDR